MPLRVTDNGQLDPDSVEELSRDELRAWIRDRLHEEDTRVQDDPKQDVGQYYLVGAVYDDLDPEAQERVQDVLMSFLRRMKNEPGTWTGQPAHALLLLVMEIGDSDFAGPIRRMAEDEVALERDDEGLHARLLQALVELGEEMDAEFWERQLDHDTSRYATYAFAGLQRQNLYQALGTVLPAVDLEDDDLRATLYSELRGLLASEEHTHDHLRTVIDDIRSLLQEEAYELICTALPELDLPGPTQEEADRPGETDYRSPRAVLGQQGYDPAPESLGYAESA